MTSSCDSCQRVTESHHLITASVLSEKSGLERWVVCHECFCRMDDQAIRRRLNFMPTLSVEQLPPRPYKYFGE